MCDRAHLFFSEIQTFDQRVSHSRNLPEVIFPRSETTKSPFDTEDIDLQAPSRLGLLLIVSNVSHASLRIPRIPLATRIPRLRRGAPIRLPILLDLTLECLSRTQEAATAELSCLETEVPAETHHVSLVFSLTRV